jgi:hypothetical protein
MVRIQPARANRRAGAQRKSERGTGRLDVALAAAAADRYDGNQRERDGGEPDRVEMFALDEADADGQRRRD